MGIWKLDGYGGFQTDLPDRGSEERAGGWQIGLKPLRGRGGDGAGISVGYLEDIKLLQGMGSEAWQARWTWEFHPGVSSGCRRGRACKKTSPQRASP